MILQLADPDLDPLVRRPGARGRAAAGRPRPRRDPGAGRRAGPRRRPSPSAASERAGSRPSSATTSWTSSTSTRARSCPDALTGYIQDRAGYDYHHHAEVGSSNAAFVGDEVTDRFCVLGSVDDHIAKLRELADAGVDQFNIYLMNGDEEAMLEIYGRDVIPALRDITAASLRRHRMRTLITNGTVVTADGSYPADVLIDGETHRRDRARPRARPA